MSDFDLNIIRDPEVFAQNRLPARSDHICYSGYREISAGSGSSLMHSLDGKWFFHCADSFEELPPDFEKEVFTVLDWLPIEVPGNIETQGFRPPMYNEISYPWDGREDVPPGAVPVKNNLIGSYVTFFNRIPSWENCRICFEGVSSAFALWLNGHYVGYSTDSFTPAEFDLSPYIRDGQNRLAVRVFKFSSGSHLEDQDGWRLSGIFRSVFLYTVPPLHLEDIHVNAGYLEDCVTPVLKGRALLSGKGSLQLSLADRRGGLVSAYFSVSDEDQGAEGLYGIDFELDVSKLEIQPWSAESPSLYTLVCQVLPTKLAQSVNYVNDGASADPVKSLEAVNSLDEAVCEACSIRVGFRRIEIKNSVLLINGKRLLLKGVNRREFSHVSGYAVRPEDIYQDLLTIKRSNINAVRTAHYPNNKIFYDYCDMLGLYVIDECNVETHGSWQYFDRIEVNEQTIPNDKKEWRSAVLERGRSLVQRDRNHPSVIMWSCGSESLGGTVFLELSNLIRSLDPTRPVHYEGITRDRRCEGISDIDSHMYMSAVRISEYLKHDKHQPFILCAVNSAGGQSCGGLLPYSALLNSEERFQGMFLREFKNQAFYKKNDAGNFYYAYGGDFDDYPNDGNRIGCGIVFADGAETSKQREVKKAYADFDFTPAEHGFYVFNRMLFTDLSAFNLRFTLLLNGETAGSYICNEALPPQQGRIIEADFSRFDSFPDEGNFSEDTEYMLQLSVELKEQKPWAVAGYEVAFAQKILFSPAFYVSLPSSAESGMINSLQKASSVPDDSTDIELICGRYNYGVNGRNFSALFSMREGGLVSYRVDGYEFMKGKPYINFWRAPTDNERVIGYPFSRAVWRSAGSYARCISHKAEKQGDCAVISFRFRLATDPVPAHAEVRYTVYHTGQIRFDVNFVKPDELPDFPEFGMMLSLKPGLSNLDFYGRGPEANYPDRKEGYPLRLYEGSSTYEEFELFLRPQECGNHCDTRYFVLTDKDGLGRLMFSCCETPFNFSALPWSPALIEEAAHPFELSEEVEKTFVKISSYTLGVGDRACLQSSEHKDGKFSLSFVMSGF